jgi:hypothetical protein
VLRDIVRAGSSDQSDIGSIAGTERLHTAALDPGRPRGPNQSATAIGLADASVGAGDEEVHSSFLLVGRGSRTVVKAVRRKALCDKYRDVRPGRPPSFGRAQDHGSARIGLTTLRNDEH